MSGKHKPKQKSPHKKWGQLSLKQREYVLEQATEAYLKARKNSSGPLDIKAMKN